ncbi:MAG: hypothetical protein Tsb009_25390 [Planctomycetaceae bacterium]
MQTDHAELFDDYWRTITRTEDFICQYGHTADPFWESRSNVDLLTAYEAVRPFLKDVSCPRVTHHPPGRLPPFAADNVHHALVKVLNPPERWFGQIGILDSDEYLALKKSAESEELLSTQLQRLQEAVREVYKAVTFDPLVGDEISKKVDVNPDNVRRYLSQLKKDGLIQHIHRVGYFRE